MKTAIAFGTFDGVHKGHRAVINETADFFGVAVTFSLPPRASNEIIMTSADKTDALKSLGVKKIVSFDFYKIKDMLPVDFLDMIKSEYAPSLISCGFNFKFGKNASGNVDTLKDYCDKNGIELRLIPPVTDGETVISSTYIRSLIKDGRVFNANKFLLFPFGFSAIVSHGDARGRTLGFPTINQPYPEKLVKARFGVYKSEVTVGKTVYRSVTNVGIRPTFKTDTVFAETHIFDFDGDLYGKNVRLSLLKFLRDEIKFSSKEELLLQIKKDIEEAKL